MAFTKVPRGSLGASSSTKSSNKIRRQSLYVKQKREREKAKREARFRMKNEEKKDPGLRRARVAKNQPITIDQKRAWDDVDDDSLGASVDLERLRKPRRIQQQEAEEWQAGVEHVSEKEQQSNRDGEEDSMLGSDDGDEDSDADAAARARAKQAIREDSTAASTTSTNLDFTPEYLSTRFPSLFSDDVPPVPKIILTTSLNSTLHHEARLLCTLFPNTTYVPRSAHKYAYKYSVREICKFASNRSHTAVIFLREDQKRPTGLDIVHLPGGPTFHFSISNWLEGKKLPGHGVPTNHYPEILLNNFKTPLGALTARLFHVLFPRQPEFEGRQVVTLHNQRDYIFVRHHRYIFRERRTTEKWVVGSDGKELKGVEGIRAGLQELGPRFTLKLRRIDKGVGRAGSEGDDAVQWEWKAKMEKKRTRFNL